jgi:hypothetical protein
VSRVRITSDGTAQGTRVFDNETGDGPLSVGLLMLYVAYKHGNTIVYVPKR